MKKILYIVLIGSLLTACSAQQRLNRLLTKHPELKSIDTVMLNDTVYIHDTITTEPDTNSIKLTLQQILMMDSLANAAQNDPVESPSETKLTTETEKAGAFLQATGDGQFLLGAYQKPDTFIIRDTLYYSKPWLIPTYLTKTEYKEKEVYKMHWYQEMFAWIGLFAFLFVIVRVILKFTIGR